MGTNALVNVIRNEEIIVTLYSDSDGMPRILGAMIKNSLEKCIKCNDHLFNDFRRNALRESSDEYQKMPFRDFLRVQLPESDITVDNIVCNKVVTDERNLAVRLMAGIFNEFNGDNLPNVVAIYTANDQENVVYHYNISLKKYKGVERPYLTVDYGYNGNREFEGFVDNYMPPKEEATDEYVF